MERIDYCRRCCSLTHVGHLMNLCKECWKEFCDELANKQEAKADAEAEEQEAVQ